MQLNDEDQWPALARINNMMHLDSDHSFYPAIDTSATITGYLTQRVHISAFECADLARAFAEVVRRLEREAQYDKPPMLDILAIAAQLHSDHTGSSDAYVCLGAAQLAHDIAALQDRYSNWRESRDAYEDAVFRMIHAALEERGALPLPHSEVM